MTCTHAATEVADACIEHCPICQRAEIERMRAALEFYRDPFAWKKLHDPDNDVRIPDFYNELCFGDTAEAALEPAVTGPPDDYTDQLKEAAFKLFDGN